MNNVLDHSTEIFSDHRRAEAERFQSALFAWGIRSNVALHIRGDREIFDTFHVSVSKRDVRAANHVLDAGRYGVIRIA
jgi:hypothetical protein